MNSWRFSEDRMKVETKLNVGAAILLLAIFISAGIAQWRLAKATRLSETFLVHRGSFCVELQRLRDDLTQTSILLESSMLEASDASGNRNTDEGGKLEVSSRLNTRLLELQRLADDPESGPASAKLAEVTPQVRELTRLEGQVAKLTMEGNAGRQQARTMLVQQVLPLRMGVEQATEFILQADVAIRDKEVQSMGDLDRTTIACLWIAALVSALLMIVRSVLSARRLKAVSLIANRAAAIASGDLTGTELGIKSSDQIGALAQGMQLMQVELASIIGTVASTAGTLSSNAVSMRSASDQMHRRIDQQAQQTQQAATAMQEMSASIAEVSRHTHSAAETARSAAQTARDGGTIVKHMLGSMHSIASAVTETSDTVGLLGEDSKRISQIVTVIDEIARKTNLLALNAAIEAARAGDQGRGFAVVAGEVRRLAESTAQATGEIASMIQGIQERTRTAIASMASGTSTVQEGVVTTNQAGEALERIIGMAERVDRMITQIAIAASQQATAADQSSASLDSIHSLSNENLAEMSTTKTGIDSLRGTVVRLEKQVDRFQVAVA